MNTIDYGGWGQAIKLVNNNIELHILKDVGPRIIHFSERDKSNIFKVFPEPDTEKWSQQWQIIGGHRLWHAPEDKIRTYIPDNQPVEVKQTADQIWFYPPCEPVTEIQKSFGIQIPDSGRSVRIIHKLTNNGLWPVRISAWALTVMKENGCALIPHPHRGSHKTDLLPSHSIVLWAYTDMSDSRFTWGKNYIFIRQDSSKITPQKIGTQNPRGWIAHISDSAIFVKTISYDSHRDYPDFGASMEVFVNGEMLEIETLCPLRNLKPGESVIHTETWHLLPIIPGFKHEKELTPGVIEMIENMFER